MPPIPTIATFPRDDVAFRAFVRSTLDAIDPDDLSATALQERVQRWHPRAIVRPQARLAGFGPSTTWYVYRDGRAGAVSEQGWWLEQDGAVVAFSRDGTFTAANPAAEALVGIDGGLVGRHWSDLVVPSARDSDGAWLWEILENGGTAQSVFDLPLSDGRRKVIEYRSSPDPSGTGFQSYWRELAVIEVADP